MAKLDELIAKAESPNDRFDGWSYGRLFAWVSSALTELRRLQARERRYRELEARVREDGGGWFADTLRAIREET